MAQVRMSQKPNAVSSNTKNINMTNSEPVHSPSFDLQCMPSFNHQDITAQSSSTSAVSEERLSADYRHPFLPQKEMIINDPCYHAVVPSSLAGSLNMGIPFLSGLPSEPNVLIPQTPMTAFSKEKFHLQQQNEELYGNTYCNPMASMFMQPQGVNPLLLPTMDFVNPELMMFLAAQQHVLSQIPTYSQQQLFNNFLMNSVANKKVNNNQMFDEKASYSKSLLQNIACSSSETPNYKHLLENQLGSEDLTGLKTFHKEFLKNHSHLLKTNLTPTNLFDCVEINKKQQLGNKEQSCSFNYSHTSQEQLNSYDFDLQNCDKSTKTKNKTKNDQNIKNGLLSNKCVKNSSELSKNREINTNANLQVEEESFSDNTSKSRRSTKSSVTKETACHPTESADSVNEEDLDVNVDVVSDDEVASATEGKINDDTVIYDVTNSEMVQVHFKKKMCRKFVPEEDDTNACEPEVKRIRLSSPQVIKQQTANTEVQNKKVPVNKTKTTQRSTILNQNGDLCFTNSPFNLDNLDVPNEKIKLNKQSTFSTKQVLRSSFLVKSCKDDEICDFKLKQSNAYTVEKAVEPTSSYRNSLEQHRTSSESCQDISDVEDRFNDQIFAEDVTDSSSAEESDCDVLPKPKVQAIIKNSKVLESTSESFVMTKPKFFIPRKKFASNGALFTKSIDKRLQPSINESNFTVRQATFNFKPLTKKTNKTICLENESISSTLSRNVLSFKESKANSNKFDTCLMTVNCTKNQNKRKQKRPKGRKPETFVLSAKLKHRFCNNTVVSSEETTQSELNEAFEKSKYTKKAEACVSDSLVSKEHSEEYSEINCNLKPNLKKKLNNTIKELKHKNTVEKQKKAHKSKKSSDTYEVMTSFNNKDLIPLSTSLKNSEDILTVSLTNNSCSGVVMGSSNCSMNLFTKNENFKVKRPTTLTKFSLEKAIPILPSITCGIGKCELATASSVSNKKHQSRVWSRGQTALDVKARKQQEEWRNMKLSDFCMPGSRTKF